MKAQNRQPMKSKYLLLIGILGISMFSCTQSPVSNLTSSIGGTITTKYNDSPSREEAKNLTDKDTNSKFLTFHSSSWVMLMAPKPYIISKYLLTSANDAPERDPKNWQLEGSHNGVTFYPIDERKNQIFQGRKSTREFTTESNKAYRYFRLTMENQSGNILQLSDFELFGKEGKPFKQLMADFDIGSQLVTELPVSFTNASLNTTKFEWTFEGGEPATSNDNNPMVVYKAPGEYQVKLTVTNGSETTSKTETIIIKDVNDWSTFIYPTVELECSGTDNPGYKKYLALIKKKGFKDIQDFVQNCCLVVAQKLYFTVDEANLHNLRSIHYKLNEGGALSYKGGDVPAIEIGFDMNYLNKFASSHNDSVAADEIYGVLCHEICHGYQNSPKNCGVYGSPNEYYGFIEGTADLARLLTGGFNPPRYPKAGGRWIDGYNTTAFFYLWVQKNKGDDEFLRKFNMSAQTINPWSADKAFNEILGESAQSLWNQYQATIVETPES